MPELASETNACGGQERAREAGLAHAALLPVLLPARSLAHLWFHAERGGTAVTRLSSCLPLVIAHVLVVEDWPGSDVESLSSKKTPLCSKRLGGVARVGSRPRGCSAQPRGATNPSLGS